MVQLEAQAQEHAALDQAGGDALVAGGGAHGAEQDGVVAAQGLERLVRERLPRPEPVLGAERVGGEARLGAALGAQRGLEDGGGLLRHLGADAVAADDGDVQGVCGGARALGHAPQATTAAGVDHIV